MKVIAKWQGKMRFETQAQNLVSLTDAPAPLGDSSALSPKQLLLASICGCTGIDIAARMRKHKQELGSLVIEAEAPKKDGKPATFASVHLRFLFEGPLDPARVVEAVVSSQTEDCGVSAMIAAHCPIYFQVFLNGSKLHEGQAMFSHV